MSCYLGIDNGGTTTKAGVFDSSGRQLSVSSRETKMLVPHMDFAERDMEEMWQTNCQVIREAVEKAEIRPEQIRAVALCGHGKGLYLWGKDGKPVRPGILSSDNRAWEYPVKWEADGTANRVYQLTGQKILACQAPALLSWLKDYELGIADRVQWIFECKDYIRFRLTGEARGELTDYSGANLLNLNTGGYDERLLSYYHLEEFSPALPPLCRADSIAGYLSDEAAGETGLLPGTPVAGGMFDVDACALAVDTTREDELCMIAGTWSINEYIRRTPVLDGTVLLNSFYCMPDYYLIEESSATSAGNYEWFLKQILPEYRECLENAGRNPYQAVDQLIQRIPHNEFCPVFSPFLMASNIHRNGKASFVGLNSSHKREHLLRGIYEGVALSHRTHFDRLMQTRKEPFRCIRLAGGAARSPVWSQMFADIMELPVLVSDVDEAGILGAVISAAVAVGDYPTITAAAEHMTRMKAVYKPDPKTFPSYRAKKYFYDMVNARLNPVWSEIQEYIDKGAFVT